MFPLATHTLRQLIHPLTGAAGDWDPLLRLASGARVAVLATETLGSHELIRDRCSITRGLIEQGGFVTVGLDCEDEAAQRVDRYVRNADGADDSAEESLHDFRRFPQWTLRNGPVVDFVGWLRAQHDLHPRARLEVAGLDTLHLNASIEQILGYLEMDDPEGAAQARWRFGCLDHFDDAQGVRPLELAESRTQMLSRVIAGDGDSESFYAALLRADPEVWTIRDRALLRAIEGIDRKTVVWTSVARAVALAPMLRERYGAAAVIIGLTTYAGTVTAATRWGGRPERMHLLGATPESIESLLYDVDCPRYLITLRDKAAVEELRDPRPQRSVGAVYTPETERTSHYLTTSLSRDFDAVVHCDETRAVEGV